MTATGARLLARLTAGILVTAPSTASASEDCLDGWVAMEPAFTDTIPADGVIALRADGYGPDQSVDIAVSPNFGEPLAGALERSAGMLVWRPAQPLTPGHGYTLHLRAYNRAADEYCGFPEEIELLETFTASEPGRPEPRWELIDVRHGVEVHPSGASEDILCCDGAYPWYDDYQGGYALGAQCAATRGEGRLHTAYAIDPEAWRLGQGQLGYRPFADLEVEHEYVSAFDPDIPLPCAEISATDLTTGYVLRGPPVCPAPGLEAQLGEYVLDPRDTLTCDTLQTCEEAEDHLLGWDLDDCRRWRGDGGCGCAAHERGDAATLGLVVLLAALRRRRRRSCFVADTDTTGAEDEVCVHADVRVCARARPRHCAALRSGRRRVHEGLVPLRARVHGRRPDRRRRRLLQPWRGHPRHDLGRGLARRRRPVTARRGRPRVRRGVDRLAPRCAPRRRPALRHAPPREQRLAPPRRTLLRPRARARAPLHGARRPEAAARLGCATTRPEPDTAGLLALLLIVAGRRRRRARSPAPPTRAPARPR